VARKRKTVKVVPSAARLIGSLRDLGYETVEAVADLVDNSIVAGARRIDVTIRWAGADSWIRIADDGAGMTGGEITEAMRYGADRDYDTEDLGKFGLGLKTASMSQCRRLTVASRVKKAGRLEARQLDLDHIERYNDWEVIVLGTAERPSPVTDTMRGRGTVVLWEDLDRILTYRDPGGGWAERHLKKLAEDLENHLGMVFHRFLQAEVKRRPLKISINGTEVPAWDPFARDEPKTKTLRKQSYEISTPYGAGVVELAPFILPPKAAFSSPTAWARMSGPNGWNRQQGLYIYRANRLIQAGTWSYLRAMDEHTKLARVALSFPTDLDAAFGINVAKMRVSLPPELRQVMEADVSATAVAARKVYDAKPDVPRPRGGGKRGSPPTRGQHTSEGSNGPDGSGAVGADGGRTGGGSNGANTAFGDPQSRRSALQQAAARVGEQDALDRIVQALTEMNSQVASDLGF
jgi:hypothetical protein